MNDRRSFFRSLALLGAAAAGCPGLFIPRFEPVRWKLTPYTGTFTEFLQLHSKRLDALILREFYGQWRWITEDDSGDHSLSFRSWVSIDTLPPQSSALVLSRRNYREKSGNFCCATPSNAILP